MAVELGKMARHPKMCRFKKQYPTYAAAERGARMCHRATGDLVHAYPCAVCGHFHVGGIEPRDAQIGKRKPRYEPTIDEQLTVWRDELVRYGLTC